MRLVRSKFAFITVSMRTIVMGMLVIGISCFAGEDLMEEDFVAETHVEEEAKTRIKYWIRKANDLTNNPHLHIARRKVVHDAVEATRKALANYERLRDQGRYRVFIMAPITMSAGAIIADDATGIGISDDVLLIPLALAAIATYIVTDPTASHTEIGRAWNDVLARTGVLAQTVKDTIAFTSRGRVADTQIMTAVHEMIRANNWRPKREDICRALAILLQEAKEAGNQQQARKIQITQKAHDCRRHRNRR